MIEEDKTSEDPIPFRGGMDSIKRTGSAIVNLRQEQKYEQNPPSFNDEELKQDFNLASAQKNAKFIGKFGIKFWAFLVLPLFAVIIGAYFTVQEIKRKDSPQIFSQSEIKNGIGKNYLSTKASQGAQNVQTPQTNSQSPPVAQDQNSSPVSPNEEKADDPKPAESSEENSFSFAVLGDTQYFKADNPQGNSQKAIKEIDKLNPDKVFSIGDVLSSCDKKDCEGKLNSFESALGTLSSKFDAVQGNHDRSGKDKSDAIWQKVFDFPTNGPDGFSELTYSLDFKNSHFVFLDSEKPDEHSINLAQRDWLEKDLSDNKKDNAFVFFHEPAYPVSSKINESLDADAKDRDALWKILDAHNVTAVFSGHEHLNSRRKIDSSIFSGAQNSLYQFIVGNTDAFDHDLPKDGVAEYSYKGNDFMFISVKGKSITAKVYSVDGKELNSFDFSK